MNDLIGIVPKLKIINAAIKYGTEMNITNFTKLQKPI